MSQALLDIRKLSLSFEPGNPVLFDLNFSLHEGETLGLVGESGSGKSLTALAIMGLLPESIQIEGSIRLNTSNGDLDLKSLSAAEWRKIRSKEMAMVFQEPMSALNPVIRCGQQVLEGIAHAQKEDAIEVFEKVQLPEPERIFKSYPHELSGGQRQRVVIAMALLRRARLLICDEPTTALDATVQKEILELLSDLQEEYGMALLFISHDLGVIRHLTDRTLVLQKGKTIESGKTEDIFLQPQELYTRSLIFSRPAQHKDVRRLPDSDSILDSEWRAEKRKAVEESERVLSVDKLSFKYPNTDKAVLENVSFELFKGQTLGLVGESGSGKSTIGKLVCGLLSGYEGSIQFKGQDLNWLSSMRQKIQMVFQDPYASLNPRLTVGQAIAEPLVYHKRVKNKAEAFERAAALLEKTGLSSNYLYRYPHEFSGGQRQRIVLARALALEPEVLVCDESVAALDVRGQAKVLNLLRDLQEEYAFSCLFISHDMAVVRFISEQIGVIDKGKIVELGPVQKVLDDPQDPYTKALLSAVFS